MPLTKRTIPRSLWALFGICLPTIVSAAGIEDFKFLKIAAPEQKAAVKTPEGELVMIGIGDRVGEQATVIDIADGRVVLEQATKEGPERLVVRFHGNQTSIEKIKQLVLQKSAENIQPQ